MLYKLVLSFSFLVVLHSCKHERNVESIPEGVQESIQLDKVALEAKDTLVSIKGSDRISGQDTIQAQGHVDVVPEAVKKIPSLPRIRFESMVYEYGEIKEGDVIEHKFAFRNTGKAPLEIKSATASCGCTVPSYPFLAIPPGEQGFIGVIFHSIGKTGEQKPSISVVTNAQPASYTLYLDGFVLEKEGK